MSGPQRIGQPVGLQTQPLDGDTVDLIVSAACAARPLPSGNEFLDGVEFAVAEFDHCYNVAHRCTGEWVWSSTVFTGNPTMPASAPSHQLHRVRLFGAQTDVVVVADDALGFTGFRHTLAAGDDVPLPWRPRERSYLLIDSARAALRIRDGFTLIVHPSGQSVTVPFAFDAACTPLGHTREHMSVDPDTGAVSVAAVTWTGFSDGPLVSADSVQEPS
jgi:hypothetical protein